MTLEAELFDQTMAAASPEPDPALIRRITRAVIMAFKQSDPGVHSFKVQLLSRSANEREGTCSHWKHL